jgi:eukaryotic-like serine/threonine-protein kinase
VHASDHWRGQHWTVWLSGGGRSYAVIQTLRLLRARQKLGKYRIERRIADGPVAAVYQALDTIQGMRVALKVPHDNAMNDYFLADFKREARLAPRLEHPNILPIRDASFIDGHFVIAMPLGEQSLAERMRRRLGTDTALKLTDQALAAVAHAHERSVIHCDIKPDNFIIFPENRLRLTDFGFSKVAQHTLKASGSGTVGYIAPEQAVGRPMFQSDVFSLGLVIYELLSGHLPEWPYDWPPSGIERVRAKLKPTMVEWLRRSIQVRPEKRYKNAVAMYNEFRRLRNGSARRRPLSRGRTIVEVDPALWQKVLFRQFQRKYRKILDTRHECKRCSGPVSEPMQACPWCGTVPPLEHYDTTFPATCPRCHRGVKLDWRFCAWCYGPGFEVDTKRRYTDHRYTARCGKEKCRGPLMPFMRYCPWCRSKVTKPWKLPGSPSRCSSCHGGVDFDFWHHCPWCAKALTR